LVHDLIQGTHTTRNRGSPCGAPAGTAIQPNDTFHTMRATQTEHCIDICNSLLRGEISAVETYTQAIEKFRDEPEVSLLEDIRRDHVESANRLRQNIHTMGGQPSNDSGAWGTWAKGVEGAAKLM